MKKTSAFLSLIVLFFLTPSCSDSSGIEVLDLSINNNIVTGIIKNNSDTDYKAIAIDFQFFDESGELQGNMIKNFNNILSNKETPFTFSASHLNPSSKVKMKEIVQKLTE